MSSDLSSPPSTHSFEIVGEVLRKRINLSAILVKKIILALSYASAYSDSEHNTVRYIVMILSTIFFEDHFNLLPQIRTWSGNYPDIGLETYYERPGNWRSTGFICNDYFEAKPVNSNVDPFIQLHKGIEMEYGLLHHTRGLLVGIKGFKWRFEEYHLVQVPLQTNPYLLTLAFHSYPKGSPEDSTRPTLSRK